MQTVFSNILKSVTGSFTSQSHPNEAIEDTTRPADTNDAAAPNLSTLTSRNPTATKHPPTTSDSTPARLERSEYLVTAPATQHRSIQYTRPRVSADERRLCGDYANPPDAVSAPPPGEWPFDTAPMKPKPGANSSFKPLNTIDRTNPFQGRKPPLTYGSPSRIARGKGQQDFLEKHLDIHSGSSPSRVRSASHGSHPPKRRKIVHPQSEVIQLDDDDDLVEIQSPPPHHLRSPPKHAISVASRSQRSRDSESALWAGSACQSIPISSFQNTDYFVNPHRKKKRHGNRVASIESQTHSPNILPEEPLTITSPVQPSSQDELAQEPGTLSHHFPSNFSNRPRINTSTSTKRVKATEDFQATKNLRDRFRRHDESVEIMEDGLEDELHTSTGGTARIVSRHSKSPSKRGSQANSPPKPKASHPWPLIYARSTGFTPGHGDLALKQVTPKVFQVVDLYTNEPVADDSIPLNKIVEAETDETTRVRVKGPLSPDGNRIMYDIQFLKTSDLKIFCYTYLQPSILPRKIQPKSDIYMEKLFNKKIDVNDKVGSSALIDESEELSLLEARARNSQRKADQRPTRRGLIQNLTSDHSHTTVQESKVSIGCTSTIPDQEPTSLPRPTRSTRTNRVLRGMVKEELPTPEQIIPYSEQHGLGKQWDKPLQYGTGRHRALVNFDDLVRLDVGQFLNDDLIDFYLIYLFEQANVPTNKVYFFNTHFYTTLTRSIPGQKSAINYAGVARWTAKEDIFNYDYIVVPINENTHWYLAIICNVTNIPRIPIVDGFALTPPVTTTALEVEPDSEQIVHALVPPGPSNISDQIPLVEQGSGQNLLDDRKLSLVDADAVNPESCSTEKVLTPISPAAETARMEELSLSDTATKVIIEPLTASPKSALKRSKRKFGPALRKYDPDMPIIVVLDSLEGTHGKAVRVLKDYIREEGRARRNIEANITQSSFYVRANHIPMQENFTDCGVFLLGYAQKFFADPRGFSNRLLSREMDSETDWPDMKALEMRDKMRDIIFQLWRKQQVERKQARAGSKGKKSAPPALKTDVATERPALQSPFQPQSPAKLEPENSSLCRSSPGKVEDSTTKSNTRHSPKVVIYSPAVKSPKRRLSLPGSSQRICVNGDASHHPVVEEFINERVQGPPLEQIHHPKRQRQENVGTGSPRVASTGKPEVPAPRTEESSDVMKEIPLIDTTQLYIDESSAIARGSSVDPIMIEDSQDAIVPYQVKDTKRKSPGTPSSTSPPTSSIEKVSCSTIENEETLVSKTSDEVELFPESQLISRLNHKSRNGGHTHQQLIRKPNATEVEEWNGFSDQDERTVPESPVEQRQSPKVHQWAGENSLPI